MNYKYTDSFLVLLLFAEKYIKEERIIDYIEISKKILHVTYEIEPQKIFIEAFYYILKLLRSKNLLKNVREFCDYAIEKYGELPDLIASKGIALFEESKTKEAIVYFEKALEYNHKSFYVYYNLGYAYLRVGQPEKAIYNLETALDIDNNSFRSFDAVKLLVQAYILADKREEAFKKAEMYFKSVPENKDENKEYKQTIHKWFVGVALSTMTEKLNYVVDEYISKYGNDPNFVQKMNYNDIKDLVLERTKNSNIAEWIEIRKNIIQGFKLGVLPIDCSLNNGLNFESISILNSISNIPACYSGNENDNSLKINVFGKIKV